MADVFEGLINTFSEYYGLDPCHYFSIPALGWKAMLKTTGRELELISDIDMHLFIEKGMKKGIFYIPKIFSKANNKYRKCYDSSKGSKFIVYFASNNLCGWEVS